MQYIATNINLEGLVN